METENNEAGELFSYEMGRACLVDSTPAAIDIPSYGTGDAIIVEAEPGRAFLAGAAPTPRQPTPRKDWDAPVRKDRDKGRKREQDDEPQARLTVRTGDFTRISTGYEHATSEPAAPAKAVKFKAVQAPILPEHLHVVPAPRRKPPAAKGVKTKTPEQIEADRQYSRDHYRKHNPGAAPFKPRAPKRAPAVIAAERAAKAARKAARATPFKDLPPELQKQARTDYHREHQNDLYIRDIFTRRAEALGMKVNAAALAVIRPRLAFLQKTNLATATSVEVLAFFEALGSVFEA